MGMHDVEPLCADVIGLPTYVVDAVIRRDMGSGIASIMNCRTINGVLIPQCEIVIAAQHLLPIGKAACDFASEMFRRHQMEMMVAIGARH